MTGLNSTEVNRLTHVNRNGAPVVEGFYVNMVNRLLDGTLWQPLHARWAIFKSEVWQIR